MFHMSEKLLKWAVPLGFFKACSCLLRRQTPPIPPTSCHQRNTEFPSTCLSHVWQACFVTSGALGWQSAGLGFVLALPVVHTGNSNFSICKMRGSNLIRDFEKISCSLSVFPGSQTICGGGRGEGVRGSLGQMGHLNPQLYWFTWKH